MPLPAKLPENQKMKLIPWGIKLSCEPGTIRGMWHNTVTVHGIGFSSQETTHPIGGCIPMSISAHH